MNMSSRITQLLSDLRHQGPLVHQITNAVTINDCANATLAIGARPVMASEREEVEEMVNQSSALVLNIGTLHKETVEAMVYAGQTANRKGIPVILDPVGVAATSYRKNAIEKLRQSMHITIVCGNISEIKTLAGEEARGSGVDAGESMEAAENCALTLARKWNTVVTVTGESDVIASTEQTATVKAGCALLTKITGTGCMTTALTGSYAAITERPIEAALAGVLVMGKAGELAEKCISTENHVGSFKTNLMDGIGSVTFDENEIDRRVRVVETNH